MIRVESVSKSFAKFPVLNSISFELNPNRVVGLLGPNGAGKTTIMRLLSGYLQSDNGTIEINGFNISLYPNEVKKRIGYLPENCPLYDEMRVDEYLKYRALIKGVLPRLIRKRVMDVKDQCSIPEIGKFIIGNLSKGYRQRIGLADCLIHNPDILILDEPAVGLDPHQIIIFRKLISSLSNNHTILLSTHIMQEVEAICDDVIIINKGNLIKSDSKYNLCNKLKKSQKMYFEINANINELKKLFSEVSFIELVKCNTINSIWSSVVIEAFNNKHEEDLFDFISHTKYKLRLLKPIESSLEDVYLEMIK
tara:strand:+ start:62 stop:985 length:924 start_codon:yes stop_codon:yes gene_type:complete